MATETAHGHGHGHGHGQHAEGQVDEHPRMDVYETTGDAWWMSEGARLIDLMQAGGTLTSAERAHAERELAARKRRSASPVVIPRESVVFEPSSWRGV